MGRKFKTGIIQTDPERFNSMFDNVKQPDDIFEGVETAPPPAAPPARDPRAPVPVSAPTPPVESVDTAPRGGFPWKPVVIGITAVVVVGASAALAYYLLASRTPATPGVPNVSTSVPETTPEPEPEPEPEPTPAPPPATAPTDRDRDGLSDEEEADLGTSPTSSDTDADGLFDKEEVETYETDPLDPDTDGDGYQDGSEVENGYNPNGPGTLFAVPTE